MLSIAGPWCIGPARGAARRPRAGALGTVLPMLTDCGRHR